MKILVINAGSSSLKYQLIDMETEAVAAKGLCERIGIEGSKLTHKANGQATEILSPMPTHQEAIQLVLNALTDEKIGVVKSLDEIGAIGHRVVASGEYFDRTTLVDDKVMELLEKTVPLAPLHNLAAITGIKACQAVVPDKPNAVVFDTSFHATMPDYAYMYGVAYEDYKKYSIRKYGFHGTSHKYVSQECLKILGKPDAKIITCHLGNGSSITAVNAGKCVDTTMGFTPLAGMPMGTRSGDVDPAVVEYLCKMKNMTVSEATTYLNKKCGMLGISGLSSDFRDLEAAIRAGNERAILAVKMFCYQNKKFIGSYAAVMNGVDAIVFTAGVGENTPVVREWTLEGLDYLGVKLDLEKNEGRCTGNYKEISADDSKVKIYIIPTNEELVIARETAELL